MEVNHTSEVQTQVRWTATIKMDREEFDNLTTVIAEADARGIHGADRVLDMFRNAEPDDGRWPVRPITALKRRAHEIVSNGGQA